MSAIITDQFRRESAKFLVTDISEGITPYFIGIGKSDPWPLEATTGVVPVPAGTINERRESLRNLASLVRVDPDMATLVIPKVAFRAGFRYKQYDQNDPGHFYASTVGSTTYLPSYVVTATAVYVCLRPGPGTATYAPTEIAYDPVSSADGYVWVKACELDTNSAFNTDQFVSVPNTGPIDTSNTAGMVYGFKVVSGGTGYDPGTKPTLKLVGDGNSGTDITLTCEVSVSGVVTAVDFDSTTITTMGFPLGYSFASVDVSGTYPGSGLTVVPLIAPFEGFGDNSQQDLPTWFAAVGASVATDMGGDAYYIPFRQISLVRDPEISETETPEDDQLSVDALSYFVVDEASTVTASAGDIIKQVSPLVGRPATAFFDVFKRVEVSTGVFEGRIYYHQNFEKAVNAKEFAATGTMSITPAAGGSSTNYVYTALGDAEYVRDTGTVLFLENRAPITRNSLQTEEIKIILQF